jgi:DNA polymerase/3'-5' exonuclease PolX
VSKHDPRPRAAVLEVAEQLVHEISTCCRLVQIAGSIRRLRPEVHDIEIVAAPHPGLDLFGESWSAQTPLDAYAESLRSEGAWTKRHAWGDRYKAFDYQGVPVDLFIVRPPAQWGVILAIRTGPADFSKRLVTRALECGMHVDGGALLDDSGSAVLHPEVVTEEMVFAALGWNYRPPEERR